MTRLATRAPQDLPQWHYDDVSDALLSGRVDLAAAWPGGWSSIREVDLPLVPSPYPAGTHRSVTYSGCHAWAIPKTCGDLQGATELVQRLSGHHVQALDAAGGSMCAHTDALASLEPVGEQDRLRLQLTQEAISSMMITYPSLRLFPSIEAAGATLISATLRGDISPADATTRLQHDARSVLRLGD